MTTKYTTFLKVKLLAFLVLGGFFCGFGQTSAQELSPSELREYSKQAEQLVKYLQFTFNTLGSPETSAQEKDILINQSYTKVFKDENVQVEDDLDETREVVTNKDVQAYLKDIDFFFKEVRFEFTVNEVEHRVSAGNEVFFKVSFTRNLQGVTVGGDTVNSTIPRFIEINLNPHDRDLKIASIYTTKLSEKEELVNWWNSLDIAWRDVLGDGFPLNDTLELKDVTTIGPSWFHTLEDSIPMTGSMVFNYLKDISKVEELDLSNNFTITSLEPLSQLTSLKVLNISNTEVNDLAPIRNLTKLEKLSFAQTKVTSLEPLKYAVSLKELFLFNTMISNIETLSNFKKLEKLYCYNTFITDLQPLEGLTHLKELWFNNTQVRDLGPLQNLSKLEMLDASNSNVADLSPLAKATSLKEVNIDRTKVKNLTALAKVKSLEVISLNETEVQDLNSLLALPNLQRVYCEKTGVRKRAAFDFMNRKPGSLVIVESSELMSWWNTLHKHWKQIFHKYVPVDFERPGVEQLQEISALTEVNISGNPEVRSLRPLEMLTNLAKLDMSNTKVTSLEHLQTLPHLEELNCSYTLIESLDPLKDKEALKIIKLDETPVDKLSALGTCAELRLLSFNTTQVSDLSPLFTLKKLEWLYADETAVSVEQVNEFLEKYPNSQVIYQTAVLNQWWSALADPWKEVFAKQIQLDAAPSKEQLHQLVKLPSLNIQDNLNIADLRPLTVFYQLKELNISKTRVRDIQPLSTLIRLETLVCTNSPVEDLRPLANLKSLKQLTLENTPVTYLDPLEGLIELKILNCAGTQVRNLRPLESIGTLETLDISNTQVKSLGPLETLSSLKNLKCYNTKVSSRKVDKFKEVFPECEVLYY
ncbi:leucine-rich repeat domain-containing protein [Rapidithrix thailandica]|uniref:Leucine-rich repeat domain-containing protein n=1 Tax=Rapidithrix thailandica TaxID=413964 RepID=A0AAW9RVW5_9BACT